MSEWQPIATAPKDGPDVDLWCVHPEHGGMRLTDAHWAETEWRDDLCPLNPGWAVTHWMPLPEPPDDAMKAGVR